MFGLSATSEDPLKVTIEDVIEDVKPVVACRGCLVTEQPLRLLDHKLADAFSKFISTVEQHDIYPKYICMYCRAVLLRFVSFRKKCLSVQSDLTKITSMGIPITLDLIKSSYTSYPLTITKHALVSLGNGISSFIQNIGESPLNPIPTTKILQQNAPNNSQIKNQDKIEILPEPDNEIISDDDNDDYKGSDDSEETNLLDDVRSINSDNYRNDTNVSFNDHVKNMKAWIKKVKSERPKKRNDHSNYRNACQPTESKTANAIRDHDYTQTQEVPNEIVKGSSTNDDENDCVLREIRNWIDTVKAKREDQNKKFLVISPRNSLLSAPSEIRNWIDTVKAKREDQNKKFLVISPGHSLLSVPNTDIDNKSLQPLTATTFPSIHRVDVTKRLSEQQKQFREKLANEKADFQKNFNVKIVEISKDQQIQQINQRQYTDKYKNAGYKCELCYSGFATKVTYDNHMARHKSVEGHVMCDICKKYYPRIKLTAHIRDFHKEDYVCNICDHISKSRCGARTHYQWHKGIKFNCKICGKLFDKPNTVQGHMHFAHKHLMVKCAICSKKYIGQKGLKAHMNLSHKEAKGAVCASCGVQFYSVSAMQRHRPQGDCDHTHSPCTACGMGFTSDSLLREHKSHCEFKKEYECELCDTRFDDITRYHYHMRYRHYKPADRLQKKSLYRYQFICEICGKSYSKPHSLKVHLRQHNGKPNFCCDYCGKGYYYKMFLANHMYKHTGLQPPTLYHCGYCNKKFPNSSSGRRHENAVHKGLRPFSCDICRRTFQTKDGMANHVRHTHHGVPWPKRTKHRLRQ